jgi:hypothetical protein
MDSLPMMAGRSVPGKGYSPVSARYSITPTLYQSLAALGASPMICSGAM